MMASSVQVRIWGVGIATSMLVAAAGAGMAPAKLGQAGSPASALNGGMARTHTEPARLGPHQAKTPNPAARPTR
jgi:hypothetical protein